MFEWLLEHTVVRGWSIFAIAVWLVVAVAISAVILLFGFHTEIPALLAIPLVFWFTWKVAK